LISAQSHRQPLNGNNSMKKTGLVSLFIFFISCTVAFGQNTQTINGREFIFHTVTKGETAYGISKKYEVPIDTIFVYNPAAKNGIKTDQVLKFPSKKAIQNSGSGNFKKHTVSQGETLSGIAHKYGVSIDDIKKANPDITNIDVLKLDQVLNIPAKQNQTVTNNNTQNINNNPNSNNNTNPSNNNSTTNNNQSGIKEEIKTVNCDSILPVKKTYNVALILPFKGNNFASTKIATEFYHGFKTGLDSVAEKMKVNVKLHVMNSTAANDSDKTEDQYDFVKLKTMDLIIGPLFSANIKPIAQFAKDNKIPIVSPFTKSLSLLEDNPYVIKITPSEKTLAKRTLQYFNTTYPNCNFILVNAARKRDSTLHVAYYEALEELGIKDTSRIHRIKSNPSAYFKGGVKNVVIYVNSTEVTVKGFITSFNQSYKNNNVILVGTEGWLEFNNVEADYYMNLNLHIPIATYADYSDSTRYDWFIKKYQGTVKADPTDYSFTGYKIGSDFMRKFLRYGGNICNCINEYKEADEFDTVPFHLYFEKPEENGGWENQAIQILRVEEDYLLEVISY